MKPKSPGARGWDGGAGEAVGWAVDVAESDGGQIGSPFPYPYHVGSCALATYASKYPAAKC
jgi:hypothetical protein